MGRVRRGCGVGARGVAGLGWWFVAFHPHLTSPLRGGRDELGKGLVFGRVGSCLRRNDGGGARMAEEVQE